MPFAVRLISVLYRTQEYYAYYKAHNDRIGEKRLVCSRAPNQCTTETTLHKVFFALFPCYAQQGSYQTVAR